MQPMMVERGVEPTREAPKASAMTQAPEVPLIERAKLFGNPVKAQGKLSPDGRWLSWLAPRDGVMNLWLTPASDPQQARPMTAEKARPISQYLWASDSRALLYVQDKGGDENFLLYRVDVESGTDDCLTPFEDTRVIIVGTSMTKQDRILVGLNNRDPQWHDVHELNVATGALTEVMRGDGYAGFLADVVSTPFRVCPSVTWPAAFIALAPQRSPAASLTYKRKPVCE